MIYANAVVDVIEPAPPHGGGLGIFRVTVWGKEPHDYVRIYDIQAKDDNIAAREGLDRFTTEVAALISRDSE